MLGVPMLRKRRCLFWRRCIGGLVLCVWRGISGEREGGKNTVSWRSLNAGSCRVRDLTVESECLVMWMTPIRRAEELPVG